MPLRPPKGGSKMQSGHFCIQVDLSCKRSMLLVFLNQHLVQRIVSILHFGQECDLTAQSLCDSWATCLNYICTELMQNNKPLLHMSLQCNLGLYDHQVLSLLLVQIRCPYLEETHWWMAQAASHTPNNRTTTVTAAAATNVTNNYYCKITSFT